MYQGTSSSSNISGEQMINNRYFLSSFVTITALGMWYTEYAVTKFQTPALPCFVTLLAIVSWYITFAKIKWEQMKLLADVAQDFDWPERWQKKLRRFRFKRPYRRLRSALDIQDGEGWLFLTYCWVCILILLSPLIIAGIAKLIESKPSPPSTTSSTVTTLY